jgi:type IX secretion system PorP/SprF family membrane protein
MRVIGLFLMLYFSLIFQGKSQDIHFTQWMHAPHTYNPAEVGNFNGTHRFHANHRNQWYSVTVPFKTYAIMADSKGLTKNKNLGLGTSVLYDVEGDSKFSTTVFNLAGSYTLKLPGDSVGEITIGVQPSMTQKKLDLTKLNFDNQYNGNFFDPNIAVSESLQRLSRWYFDLALGARGKVIFNQKNYLELGISAYNLLQPKQSFFDAQGVRLDPRLNGIIKLNHQLNEKVLIQPGFLFSKQGKFSSYNLGVNVYYDISTSKYLTQKVFGGIYGRTRDAGDLIVGMVYGDWTVAGSYDFNFSTLVPASNYQGGFEIAVIYIVSKPHKRPAYKSCPPYL